MAYIPSKCSISDYEQVVYNGETKNKLYISFGGNELIDADHYCEKLTIKSRLLKNGNNYFSLDNFVSKEATLILHKVEIGKIKDPVIIELGTYIDKVQDYVYVPFGVFNIQGTPTNDKDKTTITLRDNSVNFDFDYNAKNEIDRNGGSATLYQILQDICKQAKVNCTVPSTLTGIDDKTGLYDNSIKARTYVSYIAEHCGKIATIDRNGYLIFVDLIGDAINLSGNNISIDNAIERPIETIQIDGKSTQATRSGKNIFNKNATFKANGATKEVLDTGVRAKLINSGNYRYFSIELGKSEFLGKTITLTRTITNSASNIGQIALYFGNETSQSKKIIFANKESGTSNIYIPNVFPENCDRVWILFYGNVAGTGNVGNYTDYTDLMITVGDTLENYEDYGVSPSPDYPSEIECVKGKNLLNNYSPDSSSTATWVATSTGGFFTASSTWLKILWKFELEVGKTYTLSYGKRNSTAIYTYIDSYTDNTYGTRKTKLISDSTALSNTFIADSKYIIVSFQNNAVVSNIDIPDIQLSCDDGSYVPYDTVQVKDVGKNLFDKNSSETQIGYFTSDGTLKSGGGSTVTTTYTKIKPNIDMTISGIILEQICFYDENKKFIERVAGIRGSTSNTFNKNANYIRFQASTNVFDLEKIQLELGTQATEYETYQENTLNIDLQGNELCSLPGNVKDELVIENGRAKIIKRVGKVVLNGDEAFYQDRELTNSFRYYTAEIIHGFNNISLSNYFVNKTIGIINSVDEQGLTVVNNRQLAMRVNKSIATTVAEFKTWLTTHNVIVYYKLATPIEIDLGEVETLSTFKGINNVSLDANMQTNMTLQYYKPKRAYTIPLNIVQSYEDGEDFKLSQVTYESGELYWNKGDNKNDTLYINSANPYITNQKNIDNIYNIVNGLEINSLKLKKQRGNPLLDCYDFIEIQTNNSNGLAKSGLFKSGIMKSMSSNAITYKTLAQNELTYNGKIMQTFDTTITKQAKTTNVSKNNEASLKKYVKSEIDGVKGELTTVVGKVDTIDVKTNNNYQEILNVFDEYTPQSDFLELENNVTRIQKDTYTKTEINQKLTNGSVTKVLTTAGTFDNNGLTIEKTNAKTKGNFNEKGMTIKDATGSTDTELLFVGYDDILNETIVRTKNIKVEKYLTIGKNSRIEDYNNGTGVFHIGE